MFNKSKKLKEESKTAKDAVKQANDAMQELSDDALDTVSGAGDPFANRPRVQTKKIDSSLRERG